MSKMKFIGEYEGDTVKYRINAAIVADEADLIMAECLLSGETLWREVDFDALPIAIKEWALAEIRKRINDDKNPL